MTRLASTAPLFEKYFEKWVVGNNSLPLFIICSSVIISLRLSPRATFQSFKASGSLILNISFFLFQIRNLRSPILRSLKLTSIPLISFLLQMGTVKESERVVIPRNIQFNDTFIL